MRRRRRRRRRNLGWSRRSRSIPGPTSIRRRRLGRRRLPHQHGPHSTNLTTGTSKNPRRSERRRPVPIRRHLRTGQHPHQHMPHPTNLTTGTGKNPRRSKGRCPVPARRHLRTGQQLHQHRFGRAIMKPEAIRIPEDAAAVEGEEKPNGPSLFRAQFLPRQVCPRRQVFSDPAVDQPIPGSPTADRRGQGLRLPSHGGVRSRAGKHFSTLRHRDARRVTMGPSDRLPRHDSRRTMRSRREPHHARTTPNGRTTAQRHGAQHPQPSDLSRMPSSRLPGQCTDTRNDWCQRPHRPCSR